MGSALRLESGRWLPTRALSCEKGRGCQCLVFAWRFGRWGGKGGEGTYTILEVGIPLDTRLSYALPVRWEGLIVRVVPVVKDLVDDLGDVLRPVGARPCPVVVEVVGLALGDGDARVGEEYPCESEHSRRYIPQAGEQEDRPDDD